MEPDDIQEIIDSMDYAGERVLELTEGLYKCGAGLGVFAPGEGELKVLDPPILASIAGSLAELVVELRGQKAETAALTTELKEMHNMFFELLCELVKAIKEK